MILNNIDPSLQLFARLATVDGVVDETEVKLLQETIDSLAASCSVAELLKSCVDADIKALCQQITNDADRFFVRFRSHAMVQIDGEVCEVEQALLDEIISHLPLPENLEQLLENSLTADEENTEVDLEAIEALYAKSSFA